MPNRVPVRAHATTCSTATLCSHTVVTVCVTARSGNFDLVSLGWLDEEGKPPHGLPQPQQVEAAAPTKASKPAPAGKRPASAKPEGECAVTASYAGARVRASRPERAAPSGYESICSCFLAGCRLAT